MKRLNHSFEAYHNKIRLSSFNRLFVFVEGKINDPYFYGKICRSVCQDVRYTIRQAEEIHTGGKSALKFCNDSAVSLEINFKAKSIRGFSFLKKN
ncbi:hypothetical protein QUF54_00460 [Candidatus Marithioploca araucensis]|uniref:Uncharacterized protein n=1 Tax=Candidatus Marithioploca araucensis TaxID=70273 RepID=A0ABT7VS08_9GAMM|nr:hypothetical protein [Candidatus Marithioploca araucensis]